jgi:hypothetical protein
VLAAVSPLWGIAAALIAAAAGLAGQALVQLHDSRDRRRSEYGRAFAAAMTWLEFPYRIARRVSDSADVRGALVESMHKAQEEIYYHQGWLRTTSPEISARYDALVATIKEQTRSHIADAWDSPGDPSASLAGRFPVATQPAVDAFIAAVRQDLSYWNRWTGRNDRRS